MSEGEAAHFVRFEGVQKSYDGETLVVEDLNLDIGQGEFLTLLGPSGSGKTTSLMMLAGFEAPTHGRIALAGKDITAVPPHKRNMGMVFQNYALFPHMSVAENIGFPLKVRGMSRADTEAKVKAALEMVRLPQFANRRPGQLSGGQQQRVAVARALVFDPDLVLMDEPLGALDKNLREELQYEIKRIHADTQTTLVYVTHDQAEALTMSTRVAVFNEGRIQQLDVPETLYEEPQNAFVAGFIGENNRLAGQVIEAGERELRVALAGTDQTISATRVQEMDKGAQTLVSIRPERVQLNPPTHFDNCFSGTLTGLVYLGDHIRLQIAALGVEELVVKVANRGDVRSLSRGDTIELGFLTSDARALDAPVAG